MKCKATIEEKRRILELAGSHFFSACFIKKDNTVRHMQCKRWTEKAFANGSKNAAPSTLKNKPEYFLAVDTQKEEFRAINLKRLISCKVNGVDYEFEYGEE